RTALEKEGRWEDFRKDIRDVKPTVVDVANDVKLGSVDAAVVWAPQIVQMSDSLRGVDLTLGKSKLSDIHSVTSAAVFRSSEQPAAALKFARYLAAPERGQATWIKYGYTAGDGDVWEETPKLTVFCGSMFRPALEETLTAFEQREGVTVRRTYNGCGVLCAAM